MLNKKDILSIILISLVSIGLISYFTVSHINSLRKLNESSNDSSDIKPLIFLDLNNKKTMQDIYQKIDHYKTIESPIKHISASTLEEEEKEEKKLRNLEDSNLFEDVSLINSATESYYYIMRWIASTAKQFTSNIILYPYAFTYGYVTENDTEIIKDFTQGAFISLDPSELGRFNNIGLKTKGTFSSKKARAVFNADFALLSIEYPRDYNNDEAFQDSIDWSTYFQTYYGKGITLSSFQEFLEAKAKDSTKTYATKINETEVIKGNLLNNGLPRFGFLIISDYLLGTEDIIISKLGETGIKNIVNYYNAGGKIIVNGKSGILLEDFGLMAKGVYNRKKILSINKADRKVNTVGCESTFGKQYEENVDDFEKQLICMSIYSWRTVTIASTFQTVKNDTNYKSLININGNNQFLVTSDVDDGLTANLTDPERYYNPLVLFRKNNRNGQIFVLNYNPVHEGGDRNIILNIIALALSKDLYMTSKVNLNTDVDSNLVDNLPIPAGEFGFKLKISLLIHNLNDKPMNNSELYLFLPENFDWDEKPSNCERKAYVAGDIPINVRRTKSIDNNKDYYYCKLNTISAYKKLDFNISIVVLNNEATQTKYQVLILEPILKYFDTKNIENLLFDPIRVNCEAAPVVRAAINPDPSSFYPLPGRGYYVDNILKVENKEQSLAYNVTYYGLIPLVSPIVNGNDQRKTQWSLQIYVNYYNSHDFQVPLTADDAEDFIYPFELKGKGVTMVLEWDGPVLPVKELYTKSTEGLGEEVNITGINLGLTTINSTSEVIKQVNYRKSERFYKLASQRLMVWVDTSTPEGAKTIYNGNIPSDLLDPVFKDRTKKDFLFSRLDLYFYENENYVNPTGITEKHIFTVDQLYPYTSKTNCVEKRGKASSQRSGGFFTNLESDKRNIIHRPYIYTNELFDYCNLKVIDPTIEGKIEEEFGNTDELKLIHYIIPNVEKDITLPGQLLNFVQEDPHHGHHKTYTSIKFIYLHSLEYILNAKYCKYGGRIIIDIGKFEINSVEDQVTVSPDQIAVYKIEYTANKIYIYFKRGLMSNEQFGKDLTLRINIENLNSEKEEKFGFVVEEMSFDLSSPPEYEIYNQVIPEKGKVETKTFEYISVFSYPALQLKTTLDRELNGFETLEPFSRYGCYFQELGHRTVYGTMESHHESDAGVQGNGGGFSLISNLGISSIPFIEYMNVGKGQVIPAGPSTSRMSWRDIWGRTWQQPLRSVFPDIPPIPPPVKNFMMTTTFEVVRNNKQIYEWPSDEDVLIHLHIKLLNNYPKYFEITRCKENQIRFVPYILNEDHSREYANTSKENLTEAELNGDKMLLRQGGMASYGVCFANEKSIVQGNEVKGQFLEQIKRAKVCADYTDAKLIADCEKELESIITLKKSSTDYDEEKSGKWNYSPLVENYYPEGYIAPDMWQLTHIDYDDNAMDKAYKYHVDNVLPNYDTKIFKPQNTIAVPIYKGLGYNIVYNKSTTFNYHNKVKSGWWSDNLQNKDDTLIAGQETCNEISVNKESNLVWVDGKDLVGSKRAGSDDAAKKIVQYRQTNIYTCLFNRKRPQYNPTKNDRSYYAANVVENNIVPIIVDLDKEDDRLYNFKCDVNQYTPENLHTLEDNYLATPTSKDWLYFAANLRGHAKESFNIVMSLKKFDMVKYEGYVKVNEGGRFVYWNPVNGPNSFLVVDDPVNVINAKRNDIQIINNIFPSDVDTFNSVIYHSYIIKDENKIDKEWPHYDYYTNSYGFGDVAVTVSIGGIRKTKPVVEKNSTTYAKIIFYNNCGFDWNMKKGAIDFEYKGDKSINANDLLFRYVHAIQVPLKYNFLNYTIVEKEYRPYITIEPSDHNTDVGPEFFDFENINVVTIRDGFKGEYNLKIFVSDDFPDRLRGKPIEIQIGLNTNYFDQFPGESLDPIKSYHNYHVKIPPIYIAVPYAKGHEKEGKVFYTSAQATNVFIQFDVGVDWQIDGIKYISEELLEKMYNATQEEHKKEKLNDLWNSIAKVKNITYSETKVNVYTKRIKIDGIKEEFEFFPKKYLDRPDEAQAIILIRSSVSQIAAGNSWPIGSLRVYYNDWINKTKITYGTSPYVTARGPWIVLTYTRKLVDYLGKGKYVDRPDQELSPDDSGTLKVQFKLQNTGNGPSYDTKYEIVIEPNLVLVDYNTGTNKLKTRKNDLGQTILTFDYGAPITGGEPKGGILYLNYSKICDDYEILTDEEKEALPKELPVAKESAVYMKIGENDTDKDTIVEHLRQPLTFAYTPKKKTSVNLDLVISGKRSDPTVTIKPKIHYVGNDTEKNIEMYIGKVDATKYTIETRQLEEIEESVKYENLYSRGNFTKEAKDKPIQKQKENKDHVVQYTVVVYGKNGTICYNSLKYEQKKIHISTAETVLIILSLIFFAAAAFFIWRGISNWQQINSGKIERSVKTTKVQKLLDD